MLKHTAIAAACLLPCPGVAQEVNLSCQLTIICVEVSNCSDWEQQIDISETADGWDVDWLQTELPSDYAGVVTLPAPETSLEPTTLRTIMHANDQTQAVQLISFDDIGNVVITLHQPHIRPRAVTGFGTCESMAE